MKSFANRLAKIALGLILGAIASSCGLELPRDIANYETACSRFDGDGKLPPDNSVFFMSSRQEDCRGKAPRFVNFRGTDPVFGEEEIASEAPKPWLNYTMHTYDEDVWLGRLLRRIDHPGNGGRVLIYVHGYENNFNSANQRAWRLSQLYFSGVPLVVVQWPSRHRYLSYTYDEDSVGWAQDFLDRLLEKLAPRANRIAIVGHSMGTRAVLEAVDRLDQTHPELSANIDKVVLASPDLDRDMALRPDGLVQRLLKTGNRKLLIYASARDQALKVSRGIHGYDRLGNSECDYDVAYRYRHDGRCSLGPNSDRLAIVETGEVASAAPHHADFVDSCYVWRDLAEFLRSDEGNRQNPPSYPWRVQAGSGERVGYTISRQLAEKSGTCKS